MTEPIVDTVVDPPGGDTADEAAIAIGTAGDDRFGVAVHCSPDRSPSVREILRVAGAEEVRA